MVAILHRKWREEKEGEERKESERGREKERERETDRGSKLRALCWLLPAEEDLSKIHKNL